MTVDNFFKADNDYLTALQQQIVSSTSPESQCGDK